MIWKVKRSKHVKHAIKNALGVGLLVIPAVLPASSAGKTYFDSNYGVWAIISFTYVLEPNTALTWRIGIWRLFGTTIGALYAYITWLIVRENPYGIVAFVTAAEIMLTWLVRSSTPGHLFGLIATLGLIGLRYAQFQSPHLPAARSPDPQKSTGGVFSRSDPNPTILSRNHRSPILGLAALRGLQISIGIVAALVVNHVLFPQHCRVLFLSGMAQVLDEVTGLYLHLSHRTLNERVRTKASVARSAKMELRIRELIARENVWLTQMEHEISLMPKPIRLYRASAESVQRIADLVSGLRRIRENVPQEAIEQVLQHRQHTVSCVCIVLFACEHAFRSRRPLPQMLPSPRKAMDALTRELTDVLQDVPRATDIGYAVAEQEVREEMIEALEVLIEVTRALFGTSAWLEGAAEGAGSFGRSGVDTPASITGRTAGTFHSTTMLHPRSCSTIDPERRSQLLSRILDPEYSGVAGGGVSMPPSSFRSMSPSSLPQPSVFVDKWGHQHDPDFRPFATYPVLTPAADEREHESWPWDADDSPSSLLRSPLRSPTIASRSSSSYNSSRSSGSRSRSASVLAPYYSPASSPVSEDRDKDRPRISPPGKIPRAALFPWTPAQRAVRVQHEIAKRNIPLPPPPPPLQEEEQEIPLTLVDSRYVPGYGHILPPTPPPHNRRAHTTAESPVSDTTTTRKKGRFRSHTVPVPACIRAEAAAEDAEGEHEDQPQSPSCTRSLRQSVYSLGLKTKLGLHHMKERVRGGPKR
ncbi:hypothetical protein FRC07_009074 [Ceratobasidium sp. 392]|nr:hypothetical protein FRC07_009074 [Ceratobasidium sp. 392]